MKELVASVYKWCSVLFFCNDPSSWRFYVSWW